MNLTNLRPDYPLVAFDLETTGVDPMRDRIVEIGLIRIEPGGRLTRWHSLINPEMPIPPDATSIHGIDDDDVARAPTFDAIAQQLYVRLETADFVGYNLARFDLPMLVREFDRVGMTLSVQGRAVIDVFSLFCRQHPRNLSAAVRTYLGREHVEAHGAVADAEASLEILESQLAVDPALPREPWRLFAQLVEVDVARRFRRSGDGTIIFNFGKHVGRPLDDVAASDPSYLNWLLGQPFLDDVHAVIREALNSSPACVAY